MKRCMFRIIRASWANKLAGSVVSKAVQGCEGQPSYQWNTECPSSVIVEKKQLIKQCIYNMDSMNDPSFKVV